MLSMTDQQAFEELKKFFETRSACEVAADSLRQSVQIGIIVGNLSCVFFKDGNKPQFEQRPATDPDVIFTLNSTAVQSLVSNPSNDIAELGINIAKSYLNKNIKIKVTGSMIALLTNGYLGVIKAGGISFAKFLGSYGISGLGKITLSGIAEEVDISIPGSGKIDAIGLKTIKSNINISGNGKCLIDVTGELNTNISGNGTIMYKTMPKSLSKNISGLGKIKYYNEEDPLLFISPDTTKINFGKDQIWFIGKKDSIRTKKHKAKPIWGGFEMGFNSYVDNNGSFTLSPGKENFELRTEKSVSVGLNILQDQIELGRSNIWLLTGLGITWNNYRFASNVVLENGPYTNANVDTTSGIGYQKSKLVAVYLTVPVMMEVFTSRNQKKAFHLGFGGMLGLRLGSHSKQKIEIDNDVSKVKVFDDFNLNPFRYGFRVAIGYRKFNIFADYYASTLFKKNEGPVLYPVNAGITFIGF